ncbi:MAG: Na+/H+ antiporter NhaC family protein [Lachnospiraceae bacterium]|nr:Na+/H+ antiporter NhaC family protein [Lachnospiraceae bacterium]MDD3614600.1 Na+/H+ antiporter NhaC family protein [Lachnospiraceae bacterium]
MGELQMINAGWLSILPPIIAIVLALITKEVYSALLVGLFSGMLIYTGFTGGNIVQSVYYMFQMMAEKLGSNGTLIMFLVLLGALVVVVTKAGGSKAYGNWAITKIKAPVGAKLATSVLGMLIFIDDYFNCLTVGTVMRPLTDRHKISREKLAYIIDSTAAPICIIAPISSWAVAVAGDLGEGGFNLFLQAIPYNLYALLTITMVLFLCFTNVDFGPMLKAEQRAKSKAEEENINEEADFNGMKVSENGKVIDLVIPVVALIALAICGMAYVGGFFSGEADFITAIGEDPSMGLAMGAFGALIVAFLMFVPRKLMSFREFMDGLVEGAKSMIPAILILVFAWSLSGVCRGLIGTGPFVSSVLEQSNVSLRILPVIVFIVAAFLSFSMGTAWGTFGILLPIVITICNSGSGANMLVASMGATLAGSVFGDHCSPISDTTILSSAGAKCNHIQHVSTQIPYALLVAGVCAIGYMITGLVSNPWIPLVVCIVLLLGVLIFIGKMQNKQMDESKIEEAVEKE